MMWASVQLARMATVFTLVGSVVGPSGSRMFSPSDVPVGFAVSAIALSSPSPSPGVGGKTKRDLIELSAEEKKKKEEAKPSGEVTKSVDRPQRPKKLPPFKVERVYVSACLLGPPDANGNSPAGVDVCARGSDTCNTPDTPAAERRWYFRVWERRRLNPPDYALIEAWRPVGRECYRPENLPPDTLVIVPEITVTWVDVYNAVRREPGLRKSVVVQPAGRTVVNADTIFSTSGTNWTKNGLQLLGFTVDVEGVPTGYLWHFGDGETLSTKKSGRPYPAKDITHRYMKRADRLAVSVDTTYAVKFRVNGGEWQPIDQPLTANGPATPLDVREAIPVLVDPNR